MNQFESIQHSLTKAFSNFQAVFQIKINPCSEIFILEYQGQSFIVEKFILDTEQVIINIDGTEIIIDNFDDKKTFKIANAQIFGFIPIDGKKGLLGFGKSYCDFIFFDNQDFCFVESKLNATSERKVNKKRQEAVEQLGNTVEEFNQKLNNNYQLFNLEAYICSPDFYPRNDATWETFARKFLEKYQIDLFETREKFCRQVSEE